MARFVLLDAGLLGMVTHPRPNPEVMKWMEKLRQEGSEVRVPEIADYELRRKLLHLNFAESVHRLDALKEAAGYIPLTTEMMLKAAEFWAEARKQGRPTADEKSLDVDMILTAQATIVKNVSNENEVIIATNNIGHLSLFADARRWQDF